MVELLVICAIKCPLIAGTWQIFVVCSKTLNVELAGILIVFPDAKSVWNNISNFEYLPTLVRLKSHLISLIRPKLISTFDLHDSIYLRHLFQLRVGLSYLRYHKNRHNFADTTSDICLCKRGVEDTSHFLLFCPFYITHRETLTARVNDILRKNNLDFIANTELYLYGHSSSKNVDNQKILAATREYIKNNNRFST